MALRKPDTRLVGIGGLITAVLVTAAALFSRGDAAVTAVVAAVVLVLVLGAMLRAVMRELLAAHERTRAELQANTALHHILAPRIPLPSMTGWSATPELAAQISAEILGGRVRHVFEAGSGVSTLIAAYALERSGREDCRVTSLDHDRIYAERTRFEVQRNALAEHVDVIDAPLVPHALRGESWLWYDLSGLTPDLPGIDLLVVDGPVLHTQPLARYPALPLLFERLTADAIVILDDAGRDSERAVVARWLAEYPGCFEHRYLPTGKGISVLRRVPARAGRAAAT